MSKQPFLETMILFEHFLNAVACAKENAAGLDIHQPQQQQSELKCHEQRQRLFCFAKDTENNALAKIISQRGTQ